MIRKNGKAKENGDDFTIHKVAKAQTCTKVKMCIFHDGTRLTKGTCGWCLTGMKKRRNLRKQNQLIESTSRRLKSS